MKILFASHSSELAGAEQSLLHLVLEAAERGHTGTVVLPEPGPLAQKLEKFSGAFDVVILPNRLWMGRRFNFLVGTARLLQAAADVPRYLAHLRAGDYAAVVVNSSVSPVPLVAARVAKIPVLQIVRESLATNPMLRSALPKSLIKRLIHGFSTSVICISNFVAQQYAYPNRVIYPQVAKEFLACRDRQAVFPESIPPRAIMCGTVSPEKGQLDAVQAVGIARALGTDVRLDIYGSGKPKDIQRLESQIQELGLTDLVAVKGPTSDMLATYASADIAVVCSRNEGFGKVTAEAVLTGCPVIAYGLGGTSEILEYGGGLLVAPSPEDLGRALNQVLTQRVVFERLRNDARSSLIREKLLNTAGLVIDSVEHLATDQNR